MFYPGTLIATNGVAHYLSEILLPDEKSQVNFYLASSKQNSKYKIITKTIYESIKGVTESKCC